MKACAITDHGTCSTAAFYLACKERINPILGCEAYDPARQAPDGSDVFGRGRGWYHLVLLAENTEGWRNCSCSRRAYDGVLLQARIDRELLEAQPRG